MILCGLGIPKESNLVEKVTSQRIHDTAIDITDSALLYDNLDIGETLYSTVKDAQGIWKAVQQGEFFDIDHQPIDSETVKQELHTLSTDLQKIAEVVENTLNSDEGKRHWPEKVLLVHNNRRSISDALKILDEMSKLFTTFDESLII